MPIQNQWWSLTPNIVGYERDDPGVYELGDSDGTVIYVGSSIAVKRRLQEHLSVSTDPCIKKRAVKYRVEYTHRYEDRERELYDEHVRLHGRPPVCNAVRP